MTNENEGLSITPTELKFRFQLGKTIPTQIILYNPTTERFAFKVKTTSPKKYCVRPSSGFVDPQSNRHVEVIMQSQKEYPSDLGGCRDKFLLQSVAAPGNEKEVTPEMFDRNAGKNVKENKLKVLLEGPPAPPAPISEEPGSEESIGHKKASSDLGTFTADGGYNVGLHAGFHKANSATLSSVEASKEYKMVKEERDALQRKLNLLSKEPQSSSSGMQAFGKSGFSMVHLILVAIIAFLIGHFTS